jgi:hypothetical protein
MRSAPDALFALLHDPSLAPRGPVRSVSQGRPAGNRPRGERDCPALLVRSGCGAVSSVGWGGGQSAVGLAGQLPAALVDGAVVGSAQQGQVSQIGRAAMEPVAQMMGLAPGQRPGTAREHPAAVADGQGGALAGLHDPAGPFDLQRLGRGTPEGRGSRASAARSCPSSPSASFGAAPGGRASTPLAAAATGGSSAPRPWSLGWPLGWRVTRTRVRHRHRPAADTPPDPAAPPPSPPNAWGRPSKLSSSTVTISWGRTPPA